MCHVWMLCSVVNWVGLGYSGLARSRVLYERLGSRFSRRVDCVVCGVYSERARDTEGSRKGTEFTGLDLRNHRPGGGGLGRRAGLPLGCVGLLGGDERFVRIPRR